ncbi:MAG: shikimate kinase [Bryobacteraceae bacterium]
MNLKLKLTPGIYLVGFMGCGKSTVGHALADEIGWNFTDLDAEIEQSAAETISHIFETQGEEAFRRLETETLRKRVMNIRTGRPQVVSVGGGAFTIQENVDLIQHHGVSIWLDTPVEVIEERIAAETHRPLAADPIRFRRLYESRRDAYGQADYRIDTGAQPPEAIVARILQLPLL